MTAVLSAFLDIEVVELEKRYPDWKGVFDLLDGFNLYRLLFGSAVLAALGAVYSGLRGRHFRGLQGEVDELNARLGAVAENVPEIIEATLRGIFDRLGFGEGGAERISVYVHQPKLNLFVPCGRFSHNPNLKLKGRTSFDDNKGCIARGWNDGWHYASDIPDPANSKAYEDHMAALYGVPRAVTKKLRMKPRTFAVRRITDNTRHLAVIVVESTCQDSFSEAEIKLQLEDVSKMLARLLTAFLPYIPDPETAADVGL